MTPRETPGLQTEGAASLIRATEVVYWLVLE